MKCSFHNFLGDIQGAMLSFIIRELCYFMHYVELTLVQENKCFAWFNNFKECYDGSFIQFDGDSTQVSENLKKKKKKPTPEVYMQRMSIYCMCLSVPQIPLESSCQLFSVVGVLLIWHD